MVYLGKILTLNKAIIHIHILNKRFVRNNFDIHEINHDFNEIFHTVV